MEAQEQVNATAIVKLKTPFYCPCCQGWKSWGCRKCGVVFATLERALAHQCVGCRPQGRA